MIIVQETFVANPGMASKLAELFKETMPTENFRVMTDMTGQFNRVIVQSWYDDLEAMDRTRKQEMANTPRDISEKMKNYIEMYQTGSREIFRVW